MDKIIEKKTGWKAAFTKKALPWWMGGGMALLVAFLILKPNRSTLRVNGESISISEVKAGEFNDYIRLSGTVQPLITVQISPIEGGRVEAILIEEGSMVKQGDEILRLSNDNLELQMLNSEAELAEKENILRNTQIQTVKNLLVVEEAGHGHIGADTILLTGIEIGAVGLHGRNQTIPPLIHFTEIHILALINKFLFIGCHNVRSFSGGKLDFDHAAGIVLIFLLHSNTIALRIVFSNDFINQVNRFHLAGEEGQIGFSCRDAHCADQHHHSHEECQDLFHKCDLHIFF